jgi:hypothetical protein
MEEMKGALRAMTEAVYRGNDETRQAALFDLLTAWALLSHDLTKHERDNKPAKRDAD